MPYSQRDEEAHICGWLAGRKGRFLDIGAYDGVVFSNTRRLAEMGWEGVCVEPSPRAFAELQQNYVTRPRVRLVNVAICPERGFAPFHDSNGDAISSFNDEHRDRWAEQFKVPFQTIYVYGVTCADFLAEFPGPYRFVNIDVEKGSWELLKQMDLDALQTDMVCVEFDDDIRQICHYGAEHGLVPIHRTEENVILGRMRPR